MRFRGIAARRLLKPCESSIRSDRKSATAPIDLCVIGEAESGKRSLVTLLALVITITLAP